MDCDALRVALKEGQELRSFRRVEEAPGSEMGVIYDCKEKLGKSPL